MEHRAVPLVIRFDGLALIKGVFILCLKLLLHFIPLRFKDLLQVYHVFLYVLRNVGPILERGLALKISTLLLLLILFF